jgi:hypothetical protein
MEKFLHPLHTGGPSFVSRRCVPALTEKLPRNFLVVTETDMRRTQNLRNVTPFSYDARRESETVKIHVGLLSA